MVETLEERHQKDVESDLSENSGNTTRKVISVYCNDNAETLWEGRGRDSKETVMLRQWESITG